MESYFGPCDDGGFAVVAGLFDGGQGGTAGRLGGGEGALLGPAKGFPAMPDQLVGQAGPDGALAEGGGFDGGARFALVED